MEKLLSIDETAELLGLKKPTIYKFVSRKQIPHIKLGGRLLFDQASLREWIAENSFSPTEKNSLS